MSHSAENSFLEPKHYARIWDDFRVDRPAPPGGGGGGTAGPTFRLAGTYAFKDAADSNDDGKLDISDPLATLSYLFLGADAPPAPGPRACGEDPTADGLGACEIECR